MERYISKTIGYQFRGISFQFALSQELFSSNGIDRGTTMLLRGLSRYIDAGLKAGSPPPRRLLDAGSGVGVIGICAARALMAAYPVEAPEAAVRPAEVPESGVHLRAQDRDELARAFTEYNARQNGLLPPVLEAHTEPLLGSGDNPQWDLILSNLPAKAGRAVLEDFIARSAALLKPGGRVLAVVVSPLASFIQDRISALGLADFDADLYPTGRADNEGSDGYQVFMYGPGPDNFKADRVLELALEPSHAEPVRLGGDFLARYPAYQRGGGEYHLEGIDYHIDAIQGAPGFDNPGGAVRVGAKLVKRLNIGKLSRILVHGPDQGHFPVWLVKHPGGQDLCLSGRNILALEASRCNLLTAAGLEVRLIPAIDLLGACRTWAKPDRLLDVGANPGFDFAAIFPEGALSKELIQGYWRGLSGLLAPDGVALIALPSSAAEQFDRVKPKGFIRLGDLKREGFRALAYGFQGGGLGGGLAPCAFTQTFHYLTF